MPAPWLQELLNTKKHLCVSFLQYVTRRLCLFSSFHMTLSNYRRIRNIFLFSGLFSVYFPYFRIAQGYIFTVLQLCNCTSNASKSGGKKKQTNFYLMLNQMCSVRPQATKHTFVLLSVFSLSAKDDISFVRNACWTCRGD